MTNYIKPVLVCVAIVWSGIQLISMASTVRFANTTAKCLQPSLKNNNEMDQMVREMQVGCKQMETEAKVIEAQLTARSR